MINDNENFYEAFKPEINLKKKIKTSEMIERKN